MRAPKVVFTSPDSGSRMGNFFHNQTKDVGRKASVKRAPQTRLEENAHEEP